MDKLKMHTPNKADENYEKLAALFPNAVTESIDEATGEVVRASIQSVTSSVHADLLMLSGQTDLSLSLTSRHASYSHIRHFVRAGIIRMCSRYAH